MASKFFDNMKSNLGKKDAWFDYALAYVGGCAYALTPTIIQSAGLDMTGFRGAVTGVVLPSVIASGFKRGGAVIAGAVGAFGVHSAFVKLNPTVYNLLGTYMFRWDPVAPSTLADYVPTLSDSSSPANNTEVVRLPDGTAVQMLRPAQIAAVPTNDTPRLPAVNQQQMQQEAINDFVPALGDPFAANHFDGPISPFDDALGDFTPDF